MCFAKFISLLLYLSDRIESRIPAIRVWVMITMRSQEEKPYPFPWISTLALSILLLNQVFNSG